MQRVVKGSVSVEKKLVSEIGPGLFILVGVQVGDSLQQADLLANKLAKLRVMSDDAGKMNLAVKDVKGSMLVVSQFTLYADTTGGNRPSFVKAARPEVARPIYERFVERLKSNGINVKTGEFGEYMEIHAEFDGPVTIIIES
jgi:D-tyrosyl-tRNA(Tyr) deacylase